MWVNSELEQPLGHVCAGCNLGSGEGEAGSDVLAVDAAQERRRVIQAGLFLPQQKLCVQDRIHLHREDRALERVRQQRNLKKPHDPHSLNVRQYSTQVFITAVSENKKSITSHYQHDWKLLDINLQTVPVP